MVLIDTNGEDVPCGVLRVVETFEHDRLPDNLLRYAHAISVKLPKHIIVGQRHTPIINRLILTVKIEIISETSVALPRQRIVGLQRSLH